MTLNNNSTNYYKVIHINILTFDVEDWFHILDHNTTTNYNNWSFLESRIEKNLDLILNTLQKHNHKATFLCLGWIARKHPELIKKIDDLGYEIGTHSDMHQPVQAMSYDQFKNDTDRSIKTLEDTIGKKIKIYRAPGFGICNNNKWILDILIELGIEIDCSILPTIEKQRGIKEFTHSRPTIIETNGKTIKEFPINTTSVMGKTTIFSGGGYFRLFPYWIIKHLMKQNDYIMNYFHPSDFDKEKPMIEGLSVPRKFKSYVGLSNSFEKFEKLLKDFDFVDITTADKLINWKEAARVLLP